MNTSGSVFSSSRTTRRRSTWSCSRSISIIRSATRSSRARWVGRSSCKATIGATRSTPARRRIEADSENEDVGGSADQRHSADGFEDHSLYRAAFALTVWIDQLFDEQPALQNEPSAVKLATHSALASAKLAAALSDDDVDEIGMTIAYLKRALKAITVSMEAAAQIALRAARFRRGNTPFSSSASSRCATALSPSWANIGANGSGASAAFKRQPLNELAATPV